MQVSKKVAEGVNWSYLSSSPAMPFGRMRWTVSFFDPCGSGSSMRIKFCDINTGKLKAEGGFTLLELIMVTVVTGVVSSSLILPFLTSIERGTLSEIYSTATYVAVDRLELGKSQGYTALTGLPGFGGIVFNTPLPVAGPPPRTYTREVVAEYVSHGVGGFAPSATATEYVRVSVTVGNPSIANITMWEIIPADF